MPPTPAIRTCLSTSSQLVQPFWQASSWTLVVLPYFNFFRIDWNWYCASTYQYWYIVSAGLISHQQISSNINQQLLTFPCFSFFSDTPSWAFKMFTVRQMLGFNGDWPECFIISPVKEYSKRFFSRRVVGSSLLMFGCKFNRCWATTQVQRAVLLEQCSLQLFTI